MATQSRKIRTSGELVRQGHTLLTRAILKDHKVEVSSRGDAFYNANAFAHPYFIFELGKATGQGVDPTLRFELHKIWKRTLLEMHRGTNEIVIARTPDEVDDDYIRVLDGGILHESFHSLYTAKSLDVDGTLATLQKHYTPLPAFSKRIGLLKTFWNVYEDSMIERRGMQDFAGALANLNFTCSMVWDREAECRDQWKPISHFTCYLRDRVKSHLTNPPLTSYDPEVVALVDILFGDLVAAGQQTTTSHECFDLAFQTYMRFLQLDSIAEDAGEDPDAAEQGDSEEEQEGDESSGPSGEDGSEEGESSPEDSEGGGQSSEGDSDEGDSEGSEGGDDGEASDEAGEPSESPSGDEAGELGQGADQVIEDLLRDLSESEMKTVNDLADEMWDKLSGLPKTVRPFDPEADVIVVVDSASQTHLTEYAKIAASVRKDTVAIRQKVLTYLRGERKIRRVQKLETGVRLGRNVSDIITHKKPRPFQRKERTPAFNTAVSIVMDESSSMLGLLSQARYMLITFAELFSAARIPFEVTGFTDTNQCAQIRKRLKARGVPEEEIGDKVMQTMPKFTRDAACRFRIFRTFDESLTRESLGKLVRVEASGNTPLADGMDFAARRLLERSEERRLLIIITDGEQSSSRCKTGSELVAITNSQVDLLEDCGVETLFVGYKSSAVRDYKNHIIVSSPSEFAQKVNDYIYQQVQQPTQRRLA